MLTNPFARRRDTHALVVGMAGVKMGDRLAQVGCADGARLAAVASKVGLSGRAVAFVGDETAASRVRKGGEQAGVLIEVELTPPTALPADQGSFDVSLVDDTAGMLGSLSEHDRGVALGELLRILRAGGRAMIVAAGRPSGVGALFKSAPTAPAYDRIAAMTAAGFKSVRVLAEREGLIFVEGVKPRS